MKDKNNGIVNKILLLISKQNYFQRNKGVILLGALFLWSSSHDHDNDVQLLQISSFYADFYESNGKWESLHAKLHFIFWPYIFHSCETIYVTNYTCSSSVGECLNKLYFVDSPVCLKCIIIKGNTIFLYRIFVYSKYI